MELFDFSILRDLRKRTGLRIGELSRASGVSASVISKLERNQTRAELDTLYRLARVFGVTAAELLNLAESRLSHPLIATEHRSEDFLFREINYRNIRCLHGKAPEGAAVSRPKIHRDDYELCWICTLYPLGLQESFRGGSCSSFNPYSGSVQVLGR